MLVSDFDFQLPDELIARYPRPERTDSRLMVAGLEKNIISDYGFADLVTLLKPGDLLVMNDTRVIPARLFGYKATGGRVEVLVERVRDKHTALVHIRSGKAPKPGAVLLLEGKIHAEVIERQDSLFLLRFAGDCSVFSLLEKHGHIPLPPYISRNDEMEDRERYQTVYANKKGAVAAPTAGLHFDKKLLRTIEEKGIETVFVTLHVGAGTFQPVRVERVKDHHMHSEYIEVPEPVCQKVRETKVRGGRVVAVGTTSLRCLETASLGGEIKPYQGETSIFIYPGFVFNTVDLLITNFHLPKSTLLMLVSAFSGKDVIMNAYHRAIEKKYRFFSYGDAMLLGKAEK